MDSVVKNRVPAVSAQVKSIAAVLHCASKMNPYITVTRFFNKS